MKLKQILAVIVCISIVGLYSCGNTQSGTASTEEQNKEICKKIFEAFDQNNTAVMDELVAENVVEHTPDPSMGDVQGLEGLKKVMNTYHNAFPDMKSTILNIVADGDMVVIHYTMEGTNTGSMGDMPATGKAIDVNGVDVIKITDGKATDHWGYVQEAKMMQQLGMMPSEESMMEDMASKEEGMNNEMENKK